MNEATVIPPALSTCESEPIHAPGSIQPFGVLLAFDAATLTLRHASENFGDMFGGGATNPFGSTAAELLGAQAEVALHDALAKDGLIDPRPIPVSIAGTDALRRHAVAHCQGGIAFVESEAADEKPAAPANVLADVRKSVGSLSAAATVAEFCAVAARTFRTLAGYDRVMVY